MESVQFLLEFHVVPNDKHSLFSSLKAHKVADFERKTKR